MLHSPSRRHALAALPALFSASGSAIAQQAERVSVVVPYPPGSAPDLLARLWATRTGAATGKPTVVENRPGANAIIGSDYVSKARPDGSVLLVVDRMTTVVNPLLYSKLPYDPAQLQGVSDLAQVDLLLAARSDAPYKTWSEFVTYAKANPGKISVGSGGPGSVHHLSLELVSRAVDARFTHVPYKGVSAAVTDMLGGQLDAVISGPELLRGHVAGGRIKVLANGAARRSPLFPETPTLTELGVTTQVLLPTTFSLYAPPGTPTATIDQLSSMSRKVMAEPDVAARLGETGLVPMSSSPARMATSLAELKPRLERLIRDANITLD